MKGIAPIVGVAIIAIAFFAGAAYLGVLDNIFPPGSFLGFQALSLDKADFSSTSDFFDGNVFILSVQQGGMAQTAEGTITKSQIDDETGKEVENDFEIDIDYSSQSCEYDIRKTNDNPVREIALKEWFCLFQSESAIEEEARKQCSDGIYDSIHYGKYSFSADCFCIEQLESHYSVGDYETPRVHTIANIKVSNGEETDNFKFDTKNNLKGYIGDDVYVSWAGYSGGTKPCPDKDPYKAIYVKEEWQNTYETLFEDYREEKETLDSVLVNRDRAQIQKAVADYQQSVETLKIPVKFGTIREASSIQKGYAEVNVDEDFREIPNYVFYIKASWIGLVQPVATPKIISADNVKGATGDVLFVDSLIRNIGEERGTIDASVTCQSPNAEGNSVVSNTLEPDEIVKYRVPITGTTNVKLVTTCTLKATSLGGTDTMDFTLELDPQLVCTPNKWTCSQDGTKVLKCNSAGSGTDVVEICEQDETCDLRANGEGYCKKKESDCAQDGETPSIFKKCCPGLKEINGVCTSEGSIFEVIARFLVSFIGGLIIGIVLLVLLFILELIFPPFRVLRKALFPTGIFSRRGMFFLLGIAIAITLLLTPYALAAAALVM